MQNELRLACEGKPCAVCERAAEEVVEEGRHDTFDMNFRRDDARRIEYCTRIGTTFFARKTVGVTLCPRTDARQARVAQPSGAVLEALGQHRARAARQRCRRASPGKALVVQKRAVPRRRDGLLEGAHGCIDAAFPGANLAFQDEGLRFGFQQAPADLGPHGAECGTRCAQTALRGYVECREASHEMNLRGEMAAAGDECSVHDRLQLRERRGAVASLHCPPCGKGGGLCA